MIHVSMERTIEDNDMEIKSENDVRSEYCEVTGTLGKCVAVQTEQSC